MPSQSGSSKPAGDVDARARRLHADAVVVDCSVNGMNHAAHQRGGVTATMVTVSGRQTSDTDETMLRIKGYLDRVKAHADEVRLVTSVADISAAKEGNQLGYILHFQGLTAINTRLYWIEMYARIGVLVMGLTYNDRNGLGCGAGEPTDTGLTYFGRQAIREMERVGVLPDVSHAGEHTAIEAVRVARGPVVLSHSNPRALVNNPRSASDDLMRAVASSGGVVGISAYAPFLDAGGSFPTLENVIDHVDYAVETVGIDHVGIGTDAASMDDAAWLTYQLQHRDLIPDRFFEPAYLGKAGYHNVDGFTGVQDFPMITRALITRGYSDADVAKLLGANWIRVFNLVWL